MKNLQTLWKSKNYRTATIIAVVSGLWLASGLVVSSDDSAAASKSEKAKDVITNKVQVRRLEAQPYDLSVKVRARTKPNRMVDLKAEVIGRITALPLEKGSLVKQGDVICEIAIEDRQLRLDETDAGVKQAQLEYDGALRLKSGGFQSKTAIAGSKAKLQTAKANLQRARLDLSNLTIKSPFDGVVDLRPVELGDYMRKGDVCARVIDLDPLVLAGQVSEADVAKITTGKTALATLRSGESLTGHIRYIGRESNSVTRTFPVEVLVDNADGKLYAGITSYLSLPVAQVSAFHIRSSLLTLDDEGRIGVRTVDDNKTVQFYLVNIIGNDDDGVWLTGVPESSLLITVGQEYVSQGEQVEYSLQTTVSEPSVKAASL